MIYTVYWKDRFGNLSVAIASDRGEALGSIDTLYRRSHVTDPYHLANGEYLIAHTNIYKNTVHHI